MLAAQKAVEFMNAHPAEGASPFRKSLSRIVSGTRQVVSGALYNMQLEVGG